MDVTLVPNAEILRTSATFDELMWALARPGVVRTLPTPNILTVAECLLDRECTFFCSDETLSLQIARTGARPVALPKAEYIFFTIPENISTTPALSALMSGDLLYPDASATIFASGTIGDGTKFGLSGPGINGALEVAIGGIGLPFWNLRSETGRYPLGWDVYVIDGDRVIGLPRSTRIEVLA